MLYPLSYGTRPAQCNVDPPLKGATRTGQHRGFSSDSSARTGHQQP